MVGMQPGAILLSLTDDPDDVIWVGDRGVDPEFLAALDPGQAPSWAEEALTAAPPQRLRFVDEWYRRPAPTHRIWIVEATAAPGAEAQLLQDLLERSRADHDRSDVVDWAIYGALEPASMCVGFLGSIGPQPEALNIRLGSGVGVQAWRPLVPVWRVQGPASPVRIRPSPSFWFRVDSPPSTETRARGSFAELWNDTAGTSDSRLSACSNP
jgi:hypothetical protein